MIRCKATMALVDNLQRLYSANVGGQVESMQPIIPGQ